MCSSYLAHYVYFCRPSVLTYQCCLCVSAIAPPIVVVVVVGLPSVDVEVPFSSRCYLFVSEIALPIVVVVVVVAVVVACACACECAYGLALILCVVFIWDWFCFVFSSVVLSLRVLIVISKRIIIMFFVLLSLGTVPHGSATAVVLCRFCYPSFAKWIYTRAIMTCLFLWGSCPFFLVG